MMTSDQFFGLEKDNPHDHIREARRWLEKEPPRSILTWEDLVSKFINELFPPSRTTNLYLLRACPHHGFTELHQVDTFYNALNPTDQDSLNSAAGGNLLERRTQDVDSQTHSCSQSANKCCDYRHDNYSQTFSSNPPPASVKAVEEICVTCGGAHPYYQCLAADGNTFPELRDNIQGYVAAAAVNYNQGNFVYRPPGQSYQAPTQQNQVVSLNELEKVKRMNEANMKAIQTQINNVKNELRNKMMNLIQASMSNQTNELKNMMASFFQMNIASTSGSGSLPSSTIANPKGELKSITTRSGIVLDGPSVPIPPPFINPEEDERVEETLMDQDLVEYTIKVLPPFVQKSKPLSQRDFVVHQRDHLHPNIPYPSRMLKQKQQEKDEVQIQKLWQMFKQLHINTTLADALILMPKYQKMLKALLSNKEKLQKLANTSLNENCSALELQEMSLFRLASSHSQLILSLLIMSDLRVPLILGRPFLRTARALIDVHGEGMILRDAKWQSHFSSHLELTSPEVKDDVFDPEGGNVLHEKLLDLDFTKDLHPPHHSDIESDLKEIEYLLHHDPIKDMDSSLKDSIDQSNLADNNLLSLTLKNVYDDPFDSKGEKIKESKLLIDELDLPCNFLLPAEYDSIFSENFSEVDALPSTNNEDKMFTDEQPPDYSFPPRFDVYPDDFLEIESDANNFDDDSFDSKGEKIKESEILTDQLDLPCDILSEYDSFNS
nr:reverse transcriptase domain-containing protein [Tanacetum cinerariifolium]